MITKQETEHNIQVSLPFFFHRHCTILYTVKAKHWITQVLVSPCGVCSRCCKHYKWRKGTVLLGGFPFEITHSSNFRRDCNNNRAICSWSACFDAFKSPRSQLQCRVLLFSVSLSALSRKGYLVKQTRQALQWTRNSHYKVYIYIGTKNKHLPEWGEMSLLHVTQWNHAMTCLFSSL